MCVCLWENQELDFGKVKLKMPLDIWVEWLSRQSDFSPQHSDSI